MWISCTTGWPLARAWYTVQAKSPVAPDGTRPVLGVTPEASTGWLCTTRSQRPLPTLSGGIRPSHAPWPERISTEPGEPCTTMCSPVSELRSSPASISGWRRTKSSKNCRDATGSAASASGSWPAIASSTIHRLRGSSRSIMPSSPTWGCRTSAPSGVGPSAGLAGSIVGSASPGALGAWSGAPGGRSPSAAALAACAGSATGGRSRSGISPAGASPPAGRACGEPAGVEVQIERRGAGLDLGPGDHAVGAARRLEADRERGPGAEGHPAGLEQRPARVAGGPQRFVHARFEQGAGDTLQPVGKRAGHELQHPGLLDQGPQVPGAQPAAATSTTPTAAWRPASSQE